MCPSYRVTRNEKDLVRGRANTLRLAISEQLGHDALTSDAMAETMKLCVSCKACKRECPTGVDMAKMKIEVLHARAQHHGISQRDKLVGYMPHYARWASRFRAFANLRNRIPALARMMEARTGISAKRKLPEWKRPFKTSPRALPSPERREGRAGGRALHGQRSTPISNRRTWRPQPRCCGLPVRGCTFPCKIGPPSAVLRAHVPGRRPRRRGPRGGAAHDRGSDAVRRAGRADHRA